jgi:hypothetical protein
MKKTKALLIGLMVCASFTPAICHGQGGAANGGVMNGYSSRTSLKAVPDGNFLVSLEFEGKERLLNLEVKNGAARCVKSNEPRLQGATGQFRMLDTGVFLVSLRKQNVTVSQFWIFRTDGSAAIREAPDRGEIQKATPVKGDSLELPK